MATEIKTWQITDDKLLPVTSTLPDSARKEEDLERWIKSNPEILGEGIVLLGEQVQTKSGRLDFLGIDFSGNAVIIELKRHILARDVLAQSIDYASDIARWSHEDFEKVCSGDPNNSLGHILNDIMEDTNSEEITLNISQRILIVGFSIEESLSRMIEWLSAKYDVSINAIVLSYTKTTKGDEILSRTVIIPEELEQEKLNKRRSFTIEMSDVPGNYDENNLKTKLKEYFTKYTSTSITVKRIQNFMLPILLSKEVVTREKMKMEMVERNYTNEKEVAYILPSISTQLGLKGNDFLRQIIHFECPNYTWEKDNFSIPQEYRELVQEVLDTL